MHVSRMMRTDVVTVSPDTGFAELLRMLACIPMRQLYVVDSEGKLLGLVSGCDLLNALFPFYIDSNLAKALTDDFSVLRQGYQANVLKTAAEVMTTEMASLKPSDHFVEAELLLRENGGNALPVVDDTGRLMGELSRKTILGYVARTVLGPGCADPEG